MVYFLIRKKREGKVADLGAEEASPIAVNIEGTRNTVELVKAIDAAHFHHVSSIVAVE